MRGAPVAIAVVVSLAASAGCGAAPPTPAPRPAAVEPAAPHNAKLPAWTYWEPVDVPAAEGATQVELPVDPARLVRPPALEARWASAPQALRAAVGARGFAIVAPSKPYDRLGDFYGALRDAQVPLVVTLDALFFAAHLALERARAEADAAVVAPNLSTMLRRLDVRLGNAAHEPPPDLSAAYRVARGVVAVALALADPTYKPARAMAPVVDAELARVLAHSAIGVSPWLEVPVDYAAMTPVGQADRDDLHAGWFRATSWLEGAALALEGRGEGRVRSVVDVGTARAHARAALLLARILQPEVDPEAQTAWAKVDRVGEVLVGDADDPSPRDLLAAIAASKVTDPAVAADWLVNVAAVDRVRHVCAHERVARALDPAGGPRGTLDGLAADQRPGSLAPSFRLVGARATPDADLLQSLVFPSVGALQRPEPPPTARDGVRSLPTALDVAAWLGAPDARAALRERGDDAYARYLETLDRQRSARPPAGSIERHRTAYRSMLDAIETYLAPSVGDRGQPGAATRAWRARKIGVAMGAWAELRHDTVRMSGVHLADLHLAVTAPDLTAPPVLVEPHPEAIAAIVATLRQARRALAAEGAIAKDGPAATLLEQVAQLAWEAMGVAVAEATDQKVPADVAASLSSLPSRLQAIEAQLGAAGGADVPLVTAVHADVPGERVLEEGLGRIEEIWVAMREPGTRRLVLAIGASIPHVEAIEPMGSRLSDSAWAARLDRGDLPAATLAASTHVSAAGSDVADAGPE